MRQHRLGDRRGAQAHAGIVAAGGDDLDRVAGQIDGAARHLDAGGGLERDVHDHVLAGGNAAEDAAGMVGGEARSASVRRDARCRAARPPRTPSPISTALTALMPIIAWAMSASSRSNTGSPRPGGTPLAITVTLRADRIAVAAQLPDVAPRAPGTRAGSGQKNGLS